MTRMTRSFCIATFVFCLFLTNPGQVLGQTTPSELPAQSHEDAPQSLAGQIFESGFESAHTEFWTWTEPALYPYAYLRAHPDPAVFPQTPANSCSEVLTITIYNLGADPATSVFFTEPNPGRFVMDQINCPEILESSEFCTVGVTFCPPSPGGLFVENLLVHWDTEILGLSPRFMVLRGESDPP